MKLVNEVSVVANGGVGEDIANRTNREIGVGF